MNSDDTVLGCPFCGKSPKYLRCLHWGVPVHFLMCRNKRCPIELQIEDESFETCVKKWNKRKSDGKLIDSKQLKNKVNRCLR